MKNETSLTRDDEARTLCIKNMVCDRCILVVRRLLDDLGVPPLAVELGVVRLAAPLTREQRLALGTRLAEVGFELLDDPRTRLVEQIKNILIERIHRDDTAPRETLSGYLTRRLPHEYSALSKLFSETEGTTIEKYVIAQKIERVKELLAYGELSLGEIAERLGYSSVAHLSAQFKSVTGITPSAFKARRDRGGRVPLDKIR